MKRKILLAVIFFATAVFLNSCEILNDCKTCRQVTYVNGAYDHATEPAEYCGAALLTIQTTPDTIDGEIRIKWECN
ncbi:MAG TPA: hypothetical protein PLV06_13495 [Bacteroidales bacterium]|nr:hypothetical protein [Bacteroidales bacterium]HPJ59303.1 hypothetical protein [Bacteroidales bacterium]HPR13396.1 hypothetical protein [Bacteroidales bacterium]HRW83924.1 hypothetical protein [Bacteroidales bacterium]